MSFAELEQKIRAYIAASASTPRILPVCGGTESKERMWVIKYIPPERLLDVLHTGKLFAASKPGYTWGDAVYVAPLASPLSTRMYGMVGVVGWVNPEALRFYDAVAPEGIDYYQQWISNVPQLFRLLTTTVHAGNANRALRNKFRSRFGIDCVYFQPDERCSGYTSKDDIWLALTCWGNGRQYVASGLSEVVKDLRWCAIAPETFVSQGLGFRALLYPELSGHSRVLVRSGYNTLATELQQAYAAGNKVVITEF